MHLSLNPLVTHAYFCNAHALHDFYMRNQLNPFNPSPCTTARGNLPPTTSIVPILIESLKDTARGRKAQLELLAHTEPLPPQALPGLALAAVHTARAI